MHGTATKASADLWISAYKCNYDVVADTTKSVVTGTGTISLPYNLIVDPRTMKIVQIVQGDGTAVDTAVDSLLVANGG